MKESSAPNPIYDASLAELTTLGLRLARAIATVAEAEQRAVAAATRWIPADDAADTSLEQATRNGLAIDAANEAIAHATPRLAALSLCFDRVSRAVRRSAALGRRLQQGWPPRATADDRGAMLIRHATRATRDAIRTHTTGDAEAAERLFADLDAQLDDPALDDLLDRPVEDIIRHLCRALGLPGGTTATNEADLSQTAQTNTGPPK